MTVKVKGVAITPGVSKNNRLYTRENIANAFRRLSARLADEGALPVVMRTHHAAGDDSARIVGQVTKASLNAAGGIEYEGVLEDTVHGKTIANLAKPKGGRKPALAAVSIYGWWMTDPEKQNVDGRAVETAGDFEIDAIDFTHSPGVTGASVAAEHAKHAHAISESTEAEITVTETGTAVVEADKEPYGNVTYADPGYQKDGKKRYPIDTPDHVRAAWSYINQADNAKAYTAAQVRRIKTRIRTAAKKVGVKIQDSWLYSGTELTESLQAYYGGINDVDGGYVQPATFCIDATNGPIRVSVSSYCIDPADLEVVTKAAMQAANDALKSMDPDMDADIDVPGVEDEDVDDLMDSTFTNGVNSANDAEKPRGRIKSDTDQMESAPDASAAPVAETTATEVAEPKEDDVAETTSPEGAATEAPAAVTEAAPAPVFDMKALAEAVVGIMDARDEAKAKAAAEAAEQAEAAKVAETEKTAAATADKAQLQEAVKNTVRELLIENAPQVSRKGYALSEQTEAASDELWEKRGDIFIAAAREAQKLGLENR